MEFQAKWIWAESHLASPNCYVYARKEFEAITAPSAEAYISCTGEYKLYVNGRYVGRGANYGENYDTHDLSHVIRPGKTVIAALCYNPGKDEADKSPAGFLLQLEISHNGDPKQVICTDETWKVRAADEWDSNSVAIHAPGRYQEVYDSRKKPVGWNVVGFNDCEWAAPAIVDRAETRLEPRQIPPLREREVHPKHVIEFGKIDRQDHLSADVAAQVYAEPTHPDSSAIKYAREMMSISGDVAVVPAGSDSYVVLDFGAETVGYPCLRIRGGGQGVVDISYSEVLDSSGRVWPIRAGFPQADRIFLHGGRQEWQAFGQRVFRYVQLTFRDVRSPISVESVSAFGIGYPVEQASTFECSDEQLNNIWQTGVYTLSLCMQDCYEDSAGVPNQSAADAQLQALLNYYCFFDSALVAQALEQAFDGELAPRASLAWVEMLYDYYRYTGDLGLVTQMYSYLTRLIDDPQHAGEDGAALNSACYYQSLRTASKLAAALTNTEDAARWHQQAAEVHRTFNERFWSERDCAYVDAENGGDTREAMYLAVLFGLADSEKSNRIWERQPESSLVPSSLFHVLQIMAKLDKTTEALDLIRAVWGSMLKRGATTWWSSLPVDGGEVTDEDLCHGSSSAPTYFLPAEILGVKPSTPGHVVIQPQVGDLQWAKGHIKTPAGYVDVEWHHEDGVFHIDIEAPPSFIVALPIAGFRDPVIDEIDLTPETPERRARKTYGWGTTIWRAGAEHDPYLDWLSSQSTEPPASYSHRDRCAVEGPYIWVRESISNHVRYEIHEA